MAGRLSSWRRKINELIQCSGLCSSLAGSFSSRYSNHASHAHTTTSNADLRGVVHAIAGCLGSRGRLHWHLISRTFSLRRFIPLGIFGRTYQNTGIAVVLQSFSIYGRVVTTFLAILLFAVLCRRYFIADFTACFSVGRSFHHHWIRWVKKNISYHCRCAWIMSERLSYTSTFHFAARKFSFTSLQFVSYQVSIYYTGNFHYTLSVPPPIF